MDSPSFPSFELGATATGARTTPARVLLVDDDEEEWLIVRSLLRGAPGAAADAAAWTLDWVAESASALERVASGRYDAYLIDYHLGAESGLELVERAVAAGCQAPLILLTRQDDPRVDERAMRAGATDYLVKEGLGAALLQRTLRYAIAGKANERELRRIAAQNAVLLSAIEGADVGVVLTEPGPLLLDGDGEERRCNRVSYVNPAFSRITGYGKAEVLGQPMPMLRGPQTAPEAVEQMQRATDDDAPCQVTALNYRSDGTPFWNEVLFGPIYDGAGQKVGHVGFLKDVSARVEAENAAREARLNLEAAQALTHLGSWSYEFSGEGSWDDRNGFWSDESYRILGLEPGAVAPSRRAWMERVHPDDLPEVSQRMERTAREGGGQAMEYRVVRPDGEERHVCVRAQVERDEANDKPVRAVGTIFDITERKRAELAELALETRLRSVTDTVPLILWALDQDGVFTLSEGRTLNQLGLQPGQVVGQSVFDVYRDSPRVLEICRRSLGGREAEEITEAGGRTFAVYVAPQFDAEGAQNGVVGVSYDVTDQFLMQQALRESEARFERIVPNVPGMVYRFVRESNGDQKFLFVSQGCREIYGVEPAKAVADAEELLGAVVPEERAAFDQSIEASARDLSPWQLEINIVRRDGERRYVRGQARPIRGENGETIWDGVLLDMTQSRRAQEAIEQSRRALNDAQQLARIGSFTYDVTSGEVVWSSEMYRLFGVPRDWTPTYEKIFDFYHPDDRAQAQERIARIMEQGTSGQAWPRIIRGDGAVRIMEAHTRTERDENGRTVRIVGSLQDVTERLEAERALRESEERYALAARATNDGLWDWNLETDTVYYSPRWKAMIGCEEDEIGSDPNEWFGRVHSEEIETLRRIVEAHLKGRGEGDHCECQYRMLCNDGSYRWMLGRGQALFDETGEAMRITGSQTDITERKQAQAQLEHHAYYDNLTGLPNRKFFSERLEHTIARGNRHPEQMFAVLFLDIDRFKNINDSLGHVPGDRLLIEAARRFAGCLRPGDTVARLGGDEFAILLDDLLSLDDVHQVAERIHSELERPFDLDGHEVFITASMGIAPGQGGESVAEEMLRNADTAMYRAKGAGRACHEVFDATMHQRAVKMLELETDLWRALERDELRLHYQPIIDLASGKISGFEALVRWQHPERGLVSPGDFIPIAEESGLIVPIGWWVLERACQQIKSWQDRFEWEQPLWMSVNLSSKQLSQTDIIERVRGALEGTGLAGTSLKLEITESVIMENTESAAAVLRQIKELGVRLSIDDFGTGYSSLSYLHRFPLDTIKVDRSFVSQMVPGARNSEIVNTIVSMAHGLTMNVVAEGVETAEQLQGLREMGCGYAQGFFISRPQEGARIEELLGQKLSW